MELEQKHWRRKRVHALYKYPPHCLQLHVWTSLWSTKGYKFYAFMCLEIFLSGILWPVQYFVCILHHLLSVQEEGLVPSHLVLLVDAPGPEPGWDHGSLVPLYDLMLYYICLIENWCCSRSLWRCSVRLAWFLRKVHDLFHTGMHTGIPRPIVWWMLIFRRWSRRRL